MYLFFAAHGETLGLVGCGAALFVDSVSAALVCSDNGTIPGNSAFKRAFDAWGLPGTILERTSGSKRNLQVLCTGFSPKNLFIFN